MITLIAQINNRALGPTLSTGMTGVGFFQRILPNLVTLGLVIGAIIFFFVILMGAIKYITSNGDKGALESARSTLRDGFIGIFVLFSLFAIVKLIESFFGFNIINIDIGPLIIQ